MFPFKSANTLPFYFSNTKVYDKNHLEYYKVLPHVRIKYEKI